MGLFGRRPAGEPFPGMSPKGLRKMVGVVETTVQGCQMIIVGQQVIAKDPDATELQRQVALSEIIDNSTRVAAYGKMLLYAASAVEKGGKPDRSDAIPAARDLAERCIGAGAILGDGLGVDRQRFDSMVSGHVSRLSEGMLA